MGSSRKNMQGSIGKKINPMLTCLFFRLDPMFFFVDIIYGFIFLKFGI
jgi:hypothetical protein